MTAAAPELGEVAYCAWRGHRTRIWRCASADFRERWTHIARQVVAAARAADAPQLSLTRDEIAWLAQQAGCVDREKVTGRPTAEGLTAQGVLDLRAKLTAALEALG